MVDDEIFFNSDYIGCGWENAILREAIVETGDKEALRLFDEEREEMRRRAKEDMKQMIKDGLIAV